MVDIIKKNTIKSMVLSYASNIIKSLHKGPIQSGCQNISAFEEHQYRPILLSLKRGVNINI